MATKLLKIECDPICGFLIRSHTATEVYNTTVQHCKSAHGKTISVADAKGMAVAV